MRSLSPTWPSTTSNSTSSTSPPTDKPSHGADSTTDKASPLLPLDSEISKSETSGLELKRMPRPANGPHSAMEEPCHPHAHTTLRRRLNTLTQYGNSTLANTLLTTPMLPSSTMS